MHGFESELYERKMEIIKNNTNLFRSVKCPECDGSSFSVIFPDNLPQGITEEELLKTYRSSSDHALFEQLVQCSACSLAYLNPRARDEIILSSYSDAIDPTFVSQNEN